MPMCLAAGCTSFTGKKNVEKKSFFRIPNPQNEYERVARWIHNMANSSLGINIKNKTFSLFLYIYIRTMSAEIHIYIYT